MAVFKNLPKFLKNLRMETRFTNLEKIKRMIVNENIKIRISKINGEEDKNVQKLFPTILMCLMMKQLTKISYQLL
jgi:hypothetical protein